MRPLLLAFLVATAACGDGGASAADAAPDATACPAAPPAGGSSCTGYAGLSCLYERCDGDGIVTARCEPDALWDVQSESCADATCSGYTCSAGSVCAAQAGGAYLVDCRPHSCGDGPLTCACVCGDATQCDRGDIVTGEALFTCYVDCGEQICP